MEKPRTPDNESERMEAVIRTGLLDTPPEDDFDNITELVSYITGSPICLITLLDGERNFLKSHHGIPLDESPRDISFCGHAINENSPMMVVNDAREDVRFRDNPLVTEFNAIFYAGVPITSVDGYKLGTLCIFDHHPKTLSEPVREALIKLTKQVERLYELRRLAKSLASSHTALYESHTQLLQHHVELSDFSRIMAHDIKSPIASLAQLSQLLAEELPDTTNPESLALVEKISLSSNALCRYIDDLLATRLRNRQCENEPMALLELMQDVKSLVVLPPNTQLTLPTTNAVLAVDRLTITHVLLNLITNAIKYNNKRVACIKVIYFESAQFHTFKVVDNGMGIDRSNLPTIFERRQQTGQADRYGQVGTGTGLCTLKTIVEGLGGDIACQSVLGEGSTFTVTIPHSVPYEQAA